MVDTRGFKETYAAILRAFFDTQDERHLAAAAELGRELVRAHVPPEELAEIHEEAIRRLAEACPGEPLREFAARISAPLMEMLMAYGLAFREQTERTRRTHDALRAGEQRFRDFAESAADCFWEVDAEARYTFVSDAFETITGLRRENVIGRRIEEVWPPRVHGEPPDEIAAAMSAHRAYKAVETRLMQPDGSEVFLRVSGKPVLDEQGTFRGYRGTAVDVTEHKRARRERAALEAQLRQAQKMEALGQLTGGIAHDFNNILASVLGYTGLALERRAAAGDGKLRGYLEAVQAAGERARDLVAQMLTFSRGGGGAPQPLAMGPFVEEAVRLLRATLPSSIELGVELADAVPAVHLDPVELHQVLMNLCVNARDATGGRGRIDIRVHSAGDAGATCASCRAVARGPHVELRVSDSGGGIAPQVRERMFDPFFTTKAPGKGTGMGLATVHGIVHAHGGHLAVETALGRGSTFRLLFPVAKGAPAATAVPERAAAPQAATPQARQADGGHILVVDDEPPVAQLLGELLEGWGYTVSVFTCAPGARAAFEQRPAAFDLVIADQTMPGMTGLELARALRARRPDVPVILCTGYSEQVDEARAREQGIGALLAKPLDTDRLLATVKALIAGRARVTRDPDLPPAAGGDRC